MSECSDTYLDLDSKLSGSITRCNPGQTPPRGAGRVHQAKHLQTSVGLDLHLMICYFTDVFPRVSARSISIFVESVSVVYFEIV